MADGKRRNEWDQTSIIWATLANPNRDTKKRKAPFCPSLIHPLRTEKDYKAPPKQVDINELRRMFGG